MWKWMWVMHLLQLSFQMQNVLPMLPVQIRWSDFDNGFWAWKKTFIYFFLQHIIQWKKIINNVQPKWGITCLTRASPIICIGYRAPRASSTKSRQIQIKLVKFVSITVAWCLIQFLVSLLLSQLLNGGARSYAVLMFLQQKWDVDIFYSKIYQKSCDKIIQQLVAIICCKQWRFITGQFLVWQAKLEPPSIH